VAQANPGHPWWRKPIDVIASSGPGAAIFRRTLHVIDRPLMRLTGGRVRMTLGMPALLLTTAGAKSGRARTVPLLYVRHGEDVAIIGTRWGSTKHPGWHYNLQAKPEATIAIKGERYEAWARPATPEEREAIWPQAVRVYPGYEKYLSRVGGREVPIYILARGAQPPPPAAPEPESEATPPPSGG
jgi:deazaflavin-dependent oxidoreductase (nitroreductase family)